MKLAYLLDYESPLMLCQYRKVLNRRFPILGKFSKLSHLCFIDYESKLILIYQEQKKPENLPDKILEL